jgi:hypothetical protein
MRTVIRNALILCLLGCTVRRSARYEVPAGFRGWVEIRYARAECSPLPVEDGQVVIRLSGDGTACTSDAYETGWAHDRYSSIGGSELRLTASGGGGSIWGNELVEERPPGGPSIRNERFFVGSEEEYKAAVAKTVPKQAGP